jgi:hypothetical protein
MGFNNALMNDVHEMLHSNAEVFTLERIDFGNLAGSIVELIVPVKDCFELHTIQQLLVI